MRNLVGVRGTVITHGAFLSDERVSLCAEKAEHTFVLLNLLAGRLITLLLPLLLGGCLMLMTPAPLVTRLLR